MKCFIKKGKKLIKIPKLKSYKDTSGDINFIPSNNKPIEIEPNSEIIIEDKGKKGQTKKVYLTGFIVEKKSEIPNE